MSQPASSTLTEGPIFKALTKLALPIMASSFLSTAYSLTDMAWIGLLGSKALTGVGIGGMFVWLSQGLSSLARMGGQVHVGQCLGAGNSQGAKNYALASIHLSILFGLLFGFLCLVFTNPLISFFQLTDAASVCHAAAYLRITCGLVLFSYINNVLTGLYTAQGDSATPLKANFIGLVLNMILDPVLILGLGPAPQLEVAGAAIATVTSQIVVMLSLLWAILRDRKQQNILKELHMFQKADPKALRAVLRLGAPTALQGSLYCMISMVLTRMIAGFGDAAVAAQRVGSQLECLCWNTADGFAAALNAFIAQNYGARKLTRARKGYTLSAGTIALWGLFIALLFIFFPKQISLLFFHEAAVIPISIQYLIILGISEPFMCVEIVAVGAISGMGNTKLCSIISIVLTGLRIPLAFLLSHSPLELNGIWWAFTISSIMKGIILHLTFYRQCKKETISKGIAQP